MTGFKIKSVQARAVNVPLSAPHPTAGGTVTSAPLVLIDLHTDGGVTGRAYLFCYTAFAAAPVAALVQSFGELIAGDALAPLELFKKIQGRLRLLGPQGLTGMAAAGIDMAAWDASDLTTIRQPLDEMCQIAADLLVVRIGGSKEPHRTTVVPNDLIIRGSTGRHPFPGTG